MVSYYITLFSKCAREAQSAPSDDLDTSFVRRKQETPLVPDRVASKFKRSHRPQALETIQVASTKQKKRESLTPVGLEAYPGG